VVFLLNLLLRCIAVLSTEESEMCEGWTENEHALAKDAVAWLVEKVKLGCDILIINNILPLQAASCLDTDVSWLLAFVGTHHTEGLLTALFASFFRGTPRDSALSFRFAPVVEYLASLPNHCPGEVVHAVETHFDRFLSYSAASHQASDLHLLQYLLALFQLCPTVLTAFLPVLLARLSEDDGNLLKTLHARELVLPSRLSEGTSNSVHTILYHLLLPVQLGRL